jgi:hypothetical protein
LAEYLFLEIEVVSYIVDVFSSFLSSNFDPSVEGFLPVFEDFGFAILSISDAVGVEPFFDFGQIFRGSFLSNQLISNLQEDVD